jgi:hypothetical protein
MLLDKRGGLVGVAICAHALDGEVSVVPSEGCLVVALWRAEADTDDLFHVMLLALLSGMDASIAQ